MAKCDLGLETSSELPPRVAGPVRRLSSRSSLGLQIGYARVSSDDQDLALQCTALKEAGCGRLYEEKVSKRSGQVEYAVMSFARSEFGFQRGKLYCLGVGCRFWT